MRHCPGKLLCLTAGKGGDAKESCRRQPNRREEEEGPVTTPLQLSPFGRSCCPCRSAGVYLSDHLAAGLGSLAVGGPFAPECQDSLPGGAILQRELADDAAESRHLDVPDRRGGLTQEQQEGVEPGQQAQKEE